MVLSVSCLLGDVQVCSSDNGMDVDLVSGDGV